MPAILVARDDFEVIRRCSRGGGGFPAGRKWKFLLGAPGATKYLVLNADEGDPGAFVNRILMECDPQSVIEGMVIAAHATGASYAYFYLREEYPLAIERMEKAVEVARERGLLGKIEQTLEKLEEGVFGECEKCGEDIGVKRLLARPVATLCTDCKAEQERLEQREA